MLGASGFLGGRLVERLVAEAGADVRVLVRRVSTASPAVRFPVEVVVGDLLDGDAVERAAAGCAVVFNCAKGTGGDASRRRGVDAEAAGRVVEAAARAGARVVHVSTFAVYDLPLDGDLDEKTGDAPPGDPYVDGKRAGERLALAAGTRLGVPVTVLQPAVIYGPRATVHASEILDEMRSGRLILVNGGTGICNAVYVDDVVTAMLLAAGTDAGAGERLLISGPEHPSWADFFGAFERMLGRRGTVPMSEADALALWHRSRARPWLIPETLRLLRREKLLRQRLMGTREGFVAQRLLGRLAPGVLRSAERWTGAPVSSEARPSEADEIAPVRPWVVQYLAKRARVRTERARQVLGYEPVFGLERGMDLTGAWARWAGLLG